MSTATKTDERRNRGFSAPAASLLARGEPMVWLTGMGLVIGLLMVVALVGFVFWQGLVTFWPGPLVSLTDHAGTTIMGEVTRTNDFTPEPTLLDGLSAAERPAAEAELARGEGELHRRLLRTGNFELTGEHFRWVEDFRIAPDGEERPEWAILFERMAWGRFYGMRPGS